MTYTPTAWIEGQPPFVTAAQLNRMEQGIVDANNLSGGPPKAGVPDTDHLRTSVGGAGVGTFIDPGVIWIDHDGILTRHVLLDVVVVNHPISAEARCDSIYAVYAGPGKQPDIVLVMGTPTAGANYVNRIGAGDPPPNSVLIRDVGIAAGGAANNIVGARDRRPFAWGFFHRWMTTAGFVARANSQGITPINLVFNPSGGTSLGGAGGAAYSRFECSGLPILVTLDCWVTNDSAAKSYSWNVAVDELPVDPYTFPANTQTMWGPFVTSAAAGATTQHRHWFPPFSVTPGSHRIGWFFNGSNNVSNLGGAATTPCIITVRELIQVVGNNGSV